MNSELTRIIVAVAGVVSKNGPGEMGAAVKIPKEMEEKKKKMFKENQFNPLASNMISVNRTLKGKVNFFLAGPKFWKALQVAGD